MHFASGANLPDSPYLPKKMMRVDKRLYLLNSIKNQDIRLSDFNRDLKHKEVDSGFSFRIGSPDKLEEQANIQRKNHKKSTSWHPGLTHPTPHLSD